MDKPKVVAWFLGDEIADDDPLAAVKRGTLALDAAAEETAAAERRGHAAARADQLARPRPCSPMPRSTRDVVWTRRRRPG